MNILELIGLISILTAVTIVIWAVVLEIGDRIRRRQVMHIERYANNDFPSLTDRERRL